MSFSKKHGYSSNPAIRFREAAPEGLRYAIIQCAYDFLNYDQIRTCLCRTLVQAPDSYNWSEIPNIRDEVMGLIGDAEWYKVYDAVEDLVSYIEDRRGYDAAVEFAGKINSIFEDIGAGWQVMAHEGVVMRGDADFEGAVASSHSVLGATGFDVAQREIREALADLSRRPEADLTGAIHHALGALEVTLRYIHGSEGDLNSLATKVGLPKPLDEALKKMWGYSSNFGRHVSPTKVPTADDAQLIVHLSSAYCKYLVSIPKV
ncbi:hypothetical protein CLV80_10960 [Yoonia maritima]|uniref:HEPN AbiJ-N-terminal domain-containing protein n=1 Tax=Yoonia maritima TaxID=1435347 RepID=A0A2T0VWM6_9RHOB|nr:hypothetical protein [Yoonia maritima]PRY76261.1 hypothetical protein CLV80_10960 [Yoonia maritima]